MGQFRERKGLIFGVLFLVLPNWLATGFSEKAQSIVARTWLRAILQLVPVLALSG
jgi:hypothetical protein